MKHMVYDDFEAKRRQFLQIMIPDSQSYRGIARPSPGKRLSSSTFIDGQPIITITHDTTEPFRALHPSRLSICLAKTGSWKALVLPRLLGSLGDGRRQTAGSVDATVGAVAVLSPLGDQLDCRGLVEVE